MKSVTYRPGDPEVVRCTEVLRVVRGLAYLLQDSVLVSADAAVWASPSDKLAEVIGVDKDLWDAAEKMESKLPIDRCCREG